MRPRRKLMPPELMRIMNLMMKTDSFKAKRKYTYTSTMGRSEFELIRTPE